MCLCTQSTQSGYSDSRRNLLFGLMRTGKTYERKMAKSMTMAKMMGSKSALMVQALLGLFESHHVMSLDQGNRGLSSFHLALLYRLSYIAGPSCTMYIARTHICDVCTPSVGDQILLFHTYFSIALRTIRQLKKKVKDFLTLFLHLFKSGFFLRAKRNFQ